MAAGEPRGERTSVVDLGADTPTASLLETVSVTTDLLAVGLSLGSLDNAGSVAEASAAVREARPGAAVLVGGPAVPDARSADRLGPTTGPLTH